MDAALASRAAPRPPGSVATVGVLSGNLRAHAGSVLGFNAMRPGSSVASACDMYRRHCARLVLSVMQGGFPAIRGTELGPRTAPFSVQPLTEPVHVVVPVAKITPPQPWQGAVK